MSPPSAAIEVSSQELRMVARVPRRSKRTAFVGATVVTVALTEEDSGPFKEAVDGETAHVDPGGPPLQLRPTVCLKPAFAVRFKP